MKTVSHQVLQGLAFMHEHGELMLSGSGQVRGRSSLFVFFRLGQCSGWTLLASPLWGVRGQGSPKG